MNLKDMIFGFGMFILGNLFMYYVYPFFQSFMSTITSTTLGDMALASSVEPVLWFLYAFVWLTVGLFVPIYLFYSGLTEK